MQFLRIKLRLLAIQFISLIPFLIFIFYLFDLWYDTRRALVYEQNLSEAKSAAWIVGTALEEAGRTVSVLSINSTVAENILKKPETVKQTLKEIKQSNSRISDIEVVQLNGKPLIWTRDGKESDGSSISDRKYFQDAIDRQKVVISKPLVKRETGKRVIVVGVPLRVEGKLFGIITASVNLDEVKSRLESTYGHSSVHTLAVVDDENEPALFADRPYPDEKQTREFRILLRDHEKVFNGPDSIIDNLYLPSEKSTMMGATAEIEQAPGWRIISMEPTVNIFAPILRLQSLIWVILGTGMIFSIGLLTFAFRKVKVVI